MADFDKDMMTDAERLSGPEKESAFIKCEGCGGNMVFDPTTQCLKCDYCGKTVDFGKDNKVEEISIEGAFEKSEKWNDEVSVYRCSNCGAMFSMRADEVSSLCPYCSTTHIVKSDDLAGIKPNALYPFLITSSQAIDFAKKWAKKQLLAPTAFKKTLQVENLRGLYLPSFTFDSKTSSYYEGRLGENKTRTVRTSDGKTRTESYIEWHYVKGTLDKFFDDVMVSSGSTPQKEINSIMPFRDDSIRVYTKEYLSGYTAGHYTRDVKACWEDAKKMIDEQLRKDILAAHGCDVIDYLNVSTKHSDVTYKYVMLPVYRFNYHFKKKDYNVTVNGNTGKISGKTPISPIRAVIAILIVLAIFAGLIYLAAISEDLADVDTRNVICHEPAITQTATDYSAQMFDTCGYTFKMNGAPVTF